MSAVATKPRRTQEERRQGTIRKLLDAATETVIEVGYSGATIQLICERAEVSQGGLFRHFPTREALMAAVGADVGQKILARYRRDFEALKDREEAAVLAIELLRDSCRSRLNQAWYELAYAARTNAVLRKALQPVAARYGADIEELGRQLLPDLAVTLGEHFSILVDTVVAIFDGESVHRFVVRKPSLEQTRLELLSALVRNLGSLRKP